MNIKFSAQTDFNENFDSGYFYEEPDETKARIYRNLQHKLTLGS